MAKRFTDTDKWKKPFIRELNSIHKLLWFYILDDCDHAGIWQADFQVASIRIGHTVTEKSMLENFGDRVQKIGPEKFFIPDFIFFQYGVLSPKNRLHLSVINILEKYKIKGLISPLEGAKDKDKDKDKDIKEGGLGETKLTPVSTEDWDRVKLNFFNAWEWKEKFCRDKKIGMDFLDQQMNFFISDIELREEYKPLKDLKSHFTNLYNKKNGTHKQTLNGDGSKLGTSQAREQALKKW